MEAIREAIGEIFHPLVGSTLTPVVVFIPLAFLVGIAGVFFRALALTMAVSLLTSLAAALGMLPLAYGIGSGAEMLKPLAIAVIGALCISVLLSLVATPTVYNVMLSRREKASLRNLVAHG